MLPPRAQLKTARLSLRPVATDDEAAVVAMLGDIEVSACLAQVPHPYSADHFQRFQREFAKPGIFFAIDDLRGTVGVIGLQNRSLSYFLSPISQGYGYATEAGRGALSEHFRCDTAPIASGFFAGNDRSANVLGKLGFKEIKRSTKHCLALGQDRPHVDMALTYDDFLAALPVLASDRLTYRDLLPHDAPALHALVSQWQVVRQLGSYPWPADPSVTLTKSAPYLGEGFEWGIFLHRQLVGTVGIHKGELGYMIAPAHHRKGYGREAARFAMRRSKLAHIEAEVWQDNLASKSLLESLGFEVLRPTQHMSKARGVLTGGIRLVWRGATPWARPGR